LSDLALWTSLISITMFAGYMSWDRIANHLLPGILGLFGSGQG
jgi:hypothetical protein